MGDEVRPWTLKGVPEDIRNAGIAAAKRAKRPIGLWMADAVLRAIQAERETGSAMVPYEAGKAPTAVPELAEVQAAMTLFKEASDALGEPPVEAKKMAWALVKKRLAGHSTRRREE